MTTRSPTTNVRAFIKGVLQWRSVAVMGGAAFPLSGAFADSGCRWVGDEAALFEWSITPAASAHRGGH